MIENCQWSRKSLRKGYSRDPHTEPEGIKEQLYRDLERAVQSEGHVKVFSGPERREWPVKEQECIGCAGRTGGRGVMAREQGRGLWRASCAISRV